MISNAVHNAFSNTLTTGMPFPCILAAFQQSERRSQMFPLKMTPDACLIFFVYLKQETSLRLKPGKASIKA